MLIALPNTESTFTCKMFLDFGGNTSFNSLSEPEEFHTFFEKTFPDAVPLMPTLMEDLQDNPTSSLVTVRCYPWASNKTLLIGDAAHGIVPFFGQGMNCGFEDCRILNELLNTHKDDWDAVVPIFQQLRKPDTDAIAQLALDNFVEMRDLVADPEFLLRKKIEARLHELFPEKWIPLYSMVSFNEKIPYSHAYTIGKRKKNIMDEVMKMPDIMTTWQSLNFQQLVHRMEEA